MVISNLKQIEHTIGEHKAKQSMEMAKLVIIEIQTKAYLTLDMLTKL